MYDAFNHLTSQTGKHWSSPDILSSTNTFTNNRRNNAAYDADGNLLSGNFPDTYSYNSAGQISAVQAVNDNTTQVFDGDGLRVKTTETTQSNGQSSTDVTYYITSSVLGGRVLTEMNQNGGKRRTFVSAGEQVLAWQMIVLGTERVMWEHRDPNSASFRTTNQNASVNDQTYVGDGAPAELDPLGADTGLVDPYWYSPPPEENLDSLVSYPSFGGAGSFGTTYSWDGIRMPANEFFEMVNMVLHGRFGIGQALMRGTRVSGTRTISDRWRVQPHVRQPDDTGDVVRVNAVAPHFIYTTLSSDITPLYGTDASGVELLSTLPQAPVQEPWVFNWGIHDFTEEERKRIRGAIEKIKGDRCRKWLEDTIRALGKPDLSVGADRPKTLDKLLEFAEFNKYDTKLTAQDMRISEERRRRIAQHYDDEWTYLNVANAVTLGPDYTRIYLMPSAFFQDEGMTGNWSGRDLSGIIAFELLHVAGFGDDAIWKYRDALQRHCGDPSDNL